MSNIRPYITINGVDSRSITGLLITKLPPITKPPVRVLTDVIDGKDGDSNTKLGYSAYDKPLEIALTSGYDVNEVIEFFNAEGVVTFSNEPDKYYNFAIYEQIDLEKLIRFKTASVSLHCQPFKFSTTEQPLIFNTDSFTITNSGNIEAKPAIAVEGEGLAEIKINGFTALAINFGEHEQAIIIDSAKLNAYYTSNIKSIVAELAPNSSGYTECNVTRYNDAQTDVYAIPFIEDDTPFTVYGGYLNVTTGELTITKDSNLQDIEPVIVQLEPVFISELIGVNNISSDTGNTTVTYSIDSTEITETGAIVTFTITEQDIERGDFANRLVNGNYDNIKLKTGSNTIELVGNISAIAFKNYSRWL